MMKIYHNPRCSKSRQTLSLVEENDKLEVILYLESTPTKAELIEILKMLDINAESLIRKKEKIYKALAIDESSFSESDWLDLMQEHPVLIERPIVVHNGKACIGRPPENVYDILD